jgi:hypothetical protein
MLFAYDQRDTDYIQTRKIHNFFGGRVLLLGRRGMDSDVPCRIGVASTSPHGLSRPAIHDGCGQFRISVSKGGKPV